MPVRSLHSVVLRWPDRKTVHDAALRWAQATGKASDVILRIGYFGSCATGDWGVGSDLDLLILVESSDLSFESRGSRYPVSRIPVPCDLLVYTEEEWRRMIEDGGRFAMTVEAEVVWLYEKG